MTSNHTWSILSPTSSIWCAGPPLATSVTLNMLTHSYWNPRSELKDRYTSMSYEQDSRCIGNNTLLPSCIMNDYVLSLLFTRREKLCSSGFSAVAGSMCGTELTADTIPTTNGCA